jgi:hypothetical protein
VRFSADRNATMGAMRGYRRRWWLSGVFTSNPLARGVDRAEGWAVGVALAVVIGAVPVSIDVSQAIQASEAKTIAAAAATRHPVDAVAVTATEAKTRGTATTYWAHLQWFDRSVTHQDTVRVPQPMKAGDRIPIWVDDDTGNRTAPPRTEADARAGGVGAGLMLWLMTAGLTGGALSLMRRLLDRMRYRRWDRDLRVLVGDSGGSNAHNS